MPDTIDANVVGLLITEETLGSPKVIPANPVWRTREPNSFDIFGGQFALTTRRPFNPSRQRKKGNVTDVDANSGWNEDVTPTNMQRLLQGFMFADIREVPRNYPYNGTQRPITAVSAAGLYTGAGTNAAFAIGHLVKAKGFGLEVNNGVFPITAVAASTITVTNGAAAIEAAPPAAATIEAVGFRFAAADVVATISPGKFILTATAGTMNDKGLVAGSWLGVDLGTMQGYGRIGVGGIAAKSLTFDKTTFVAAADTGVGKTCSIYFGDVLKNESDVALIKKRSYAQERPLGNDGTGQQSEYILGAHAAEFTWNSPLPGADSKVNVDFTFVGMDKAERTGVQGLLSAVAGSSTVAALGEAFINTSNNVFQLRMNIIDPTTINPSPLFAKVSEWEASVNNNISPRKAQGTFGSFDATAGMFDVDLTCTAYFRSVQAIQSIKNNSDVTFHAIYSKSNFAIIIDFPLLALGGGELEIEMDEPIMVPLEGGAAESPFGHTLCLTFLPYIPNFGIA